jgi:hypothetical protein
MSLARQAWRLFPRSSLSTAARNAYRPPFRLGASRRQLELPQPPSFASFRPFTIASRLRENREAQDGLQNNRDQSQPVPSPEANVSQSDAKLLSHLAATSTPKPDVPSYQMVFTCKKCSERSAHTISKQGYHHGTVLVTCPGCKSRHLMSDHLKVPSPRTAVFDGV